MILLAMRSSLRETCCSNYIMYVDQQVTPHTTNHGEKTSVHAAGTSNNLSKIIAFLIRIRSWFEKLLLRKQQKQLDKTTSCSSSYSYDHGCKDMKW